MTKKDYILIAGALRQASLDGLGRDLSSDAMRLEYDGVMLAAHYVAHEMGMENGKFDRARFLSAVRGEGN